MITAGALSAVYGIVQYGIFDFDNLGQRVQGTLGHYMTYSGLIMLVACVAAARVMFRPQDRLWAALIMPAVLVALALTFSRNAWVGACAGISLLFVLRDFRLVALVPVVAALFLTFAPAQLSNRFYSTVQPDRSRPTPTALAMIRSGLRIIKDDPLTGVGPDMVIQVYPHYRDPRRVTQQRTAPAQRAAPDRRRARAAGARRLALVHRGAGARLPGARRRTSALRSLPTAALAGVVAMLAAGHVRVQFRRFRVPDDLPAARDAAVRRRSRPGHGACRPPLAASRLTMSAAGPLIDRIAGRSVLVVGDLMLDHFVYRPGDPDFARGARARRPVRARRVPPRRRLERRRQHRRARRSRQRRLASSAPTRRARGSLEELAGRRSTRPASSPTRRAARPGSCAWSRPGTSRSRGSTTRAMTRSLARSKPRSSARIVAQVRAADAVLISDYLKGVISRGVARACIEEAARRASRCWSTRRCRTSTTTPAPP